MILILALTDHTMKGEPMNPKRIMANNNNKGIIFDFGNTNAFYQTNFRSLSYNSKYCPINDALSNGNLFSELTKDAIYYFCSGAREAMRQNNFDRPCCK